MTVTAYPKNKPVRLSPKKYRELGEDVLERDNNMCVCTGEHTTEPPHHIKYKSQGGDDVKENLATVSSRVHDIIHNGGKDQKRELIEEIISVWGFKNVIAYFLFGVVNERNK